MLSPFVDPNAHLLPPSPLHGLKVNCVPCQTTETSVQHINASFERNLPRLFGLVIKPGAIQWKEEPIAIIGGGPSLGYTLDKARDFKMTMVCGTAHDHVVEQGITPTIAVLYDPIPENVDWFKKPQKETLYCIASHSHPAVFDHFKDYNVCIWHPLGDVPTEYYRNEAALGGGCMVTLRAINIAMFLGYWNQHIFGLDSCYLPDGKTHAYDNWTPPHALEVRIGNPETGRQFKTSMGMLAQAEQFFQQAEMSRKLMKCTVYGDNMIAEMIRTGQPGEGGVQIGQW